MKILLAPDSFKNSMSAVRVCEIMQQAILDVCTEVEVEMLPIADGGEGTIEAMKLALESGTKENRVREYHIEVKGSLANVKEKVSYLGCGDTAIIEMAQANGLERLNGELDPLNASTCGTGEMIADAMEKGFRNILIGIGGSATNDGGTGAMQALGVRFLDRQGQEIKCMCGKELANIDRIDVSGIHPAISKTSFTVMCDVDNPLTGPYGATYIYGPQKGAGKDVLDKLESGMLIYRKKLDQLSEILTGGRDMINRAGSETPGAGAAGGLGAALMVFLGARPVPGIEAVLDYGQFDEKASNADLIITGEGKTDAQTLRGKAVAGICKRAKKMGVPVMLIAGSVELDENEMISLEINYYSSLMNSDIDLSYALHHAESLLYKRTCEMLEKLI